MAPPNAKSSVNLCLTQILTYEQLACGPKHKLSSLAPHAVRYA